MGDEEWTDEALEAVQLRFQLTQRSADLSVLIAEQKSIQGVISSLRMEKDNLADYRNRITREVDARMAIKQINGVTDAKRESDVEKALRQVVDWIDETIDKWDKVSRRCR